ncbi:MAG: radical SAM protein [Gammaproteobacteria bacterium]
MTNLIHREGHGPARPGLYSQAHPNGRAKFVDPFTTLDGQTRAAVDLTRLETLWFNTGTLCNLTCQTCYIESSPRNDRLTWITPTEVARFLDEAETLAEPPHTIGFTGGEPFMNPGFINMLADALGRGFDVLVLTNAMRPMMKCRDDFAALHASYPGRITVRVSIDHYRQLEHESERGRRAWAPLLRGLTWLNQLGVRLHVAGRTRWQESEAALRSGYAALFQQLGLAVDADNPTELVLFPEMDLNVEVPEITTACWGILNVAPESVMCAKTRMVVKRQDSPAPVVLACTLIAYDERFELGTTLTDAARRVPLNHPHCARFCVLGGGSCS